ncbi:hypothetical protein [Candidatus Deferrimicrobium sp.]|uniref:hypothetical protein n=1 Tax=Candidatus Deferrimicrobium sp. TaxID=3060586 RepID=UPI002ED209AA
MAFLERKGVLAALIAAAGALMAFVSLTPAPGRGGSLLLAFLFFIAVVEGCIAAAAAGATVNARWVCSVRKELLSVTPLLLVGALLLLLLIPFVDSYPWAGRPGIWLRKDFFIGRNFAFLLLSYVTARRFATAPVGGEGTKSRAAWYLLAFVVSQSLAAFDLVMSLEYPWVSALLGGYFFIEALYGGFAVSALLYLLLRGTPPADRVPGARSDLSDLSILMFGFSLMWAGLFFAQFLTIWYGNLPEEVGFIARRVAASPMRELSVAVLFLLFFIPFPALVSTRAKSNPYVVSAVSLSILSGILVERYVFLAPVVRFSPIALATDFTCLLILFVAMIYKRSRGADRET